ncbi:signal peptide peptidase SppA [Variovorax boronicumulans]|jgi:signal peptide peptidase SppA|uniref:S49 family peptidase n=1 Tax=Variovorax boronicumulans TaxID=436515 RepID=UPI00278461D8|nr:S49 family peptidase [Variovorax boronicumulans]MDQ0082934.1 signal peptide peptidase SppA [Variovorax boronicumulans]
MNFHFLDFVLRTPWALRPETMNAYAAVLAARYGRKMGLVALDDDPNGGARAEPLAARQNAPARAGSIAVIPVRGTIVQYAEQLDMCEGGTTTSSISQALNSALVDETVGSILLHIHSPGGSVYGVQELGDEIRAARAQKPVVAIADSLAASAAYWIGCQAGEFYCTPGGEVGSIGVWQAHQDVSKMFADMGVNITLISAGKFKTEGHPYGPLDEEAQRFFQARTDDYYAAFTNAVAKGRNVPVAQVRDGMGQGRVLGADAALAEKMIDGVMPFADVVRKMQRDAKSTRPAGRSSRANANEIELLAL